jgi:hypothetical protein
VRTQATGSAKGHGGLDSELARFIARGGNDTALVGASTYNDRFAAEIGSVEEFH